MHSANKVSLLFRDWRINGGIGGFTVYLQCQLTVLMQGKMYLRERPGRLTYHPPDIGFLTYARYALLAINDYYYLGIARSMRCREFKIRLSPSDHMHTLLASAVDT